MPTSLGSSENQMRFIFGIFLTPLSQCLACSNKTVNISLLGILPLNFLFPLGCFPRHSHKPELWLPSDQNFPEALDFRHFQFDLLWHHGCLCHGDDVQLTCVGDMKCRGQGPECTLVCKDSLTSGNRFDPATFTHGRSTWISAFTASVCFPEGP